MSDNEGIAFEQALTQDRYDTTTRLIYADWLEEHGLDDQASEQRRMATPEWVEASQWVENFASDCGFNHAEYERDEDSEDGYKVTGEPITYEDVINAGYEAIQSGDYFTQIGSENARYVVGDAQTYWDKWEIVTGVKVSPENRQHTVFSCSC